ncbi:hypothetical protein IFM12275_58790 [Nocardia sputorum]|uniref:DUF488 family protein n=2 Tax=Nocardiaceae TaxID=85025 RepID=A0ABM8CRT7_9NOCA|nr:hypothetical protein IFM12275_58790 [Nocardia sputorum]BDT97685.1 hypothetical protein IFM12276_07140 [Nocardia sputorum]
MTAMTQQPQSGFRVKRVYDEPDPDDGTRVLVDRLWPRGITKAQARVDRWPKALTPSTELRRWFHADRDARGPEFARRYRAELAVPEVQQDLRDLRALAAEGPVTLLTAVQDPAHSHVPVLLELLR